MGYDISIGEKMVGSEGDVFVATLELKNAPADGVPTDHTNTRWPSYSGWQLLMDECNLPYELFIGQHPGYVKVTKQHQELVDLAILEPVSACNIPRLNWLKFWIDWSLENCKEPIITNT